MTEEQAVNYLKEIIQKRENCLTPGHEYFSAGDAHFEADSVIRMFLADNGYTDLCEIYNSMEDDFYYD